MKSEIKIAIIGLGYVGLPLAVEFGKHYKTVGFDVNSKRVKELNSGIDKTLEVESKDLKAAKLLKEAGRVCHLFLRVYHPSRINLVL